MNYLLTVSGEDKKGLVEGLAGSIESLGGNWLESRLCRLGGQFAGIVHLEFQQTPKELPKSVQSLTCEWQVVESSAQTTSEPDLASIRITAADRPGIVKQISHILAAGGANVEEIESRVRSAPFSGERMFEALYTISLDQDVDRERLRDGLEGLAEELMCDLEYQES